MKKTIAKVNNTKTWFVEKINEIDKPLAIVIKKKKRRRRKNQSNKIRSENGEITTENTEMQKIIRDYYKQLYANKMDNLEGMDYFFFIILSFIYFWLCRFSLAVTSRLFSSCGAWVSYCGGFYCCRAEQ